METFKNKAELQRVITRKIVFVNTNSPLGFIQVSSKALHDKLRPFRTVTGEVVRSADNSYQVGLNFIDVSH